MILSKRSFVIFALAVGFFLLIATLTVPVWAQEAGEDQYAPGPDDQCPGAEVVEEVGPTTDNATNSFEATGDTLRVTYQVQFVEGNPFASLDIDIEDRFGFVEGESFDESGTDSFIVVTDGPESFDLITELDPANSGEYTVVVEDCVGEQQNSNDGDDGSEDNDANDEDIDDGDVISDSVPDKDLPETGGVPLLGVAFFMFAGAGLLTAVVRRRR